MTANKHAVSFWGDKHVLELVVMAAQLYDYTKTYQFVCFKVVSCMYI